MERAGPGRDKRMRTPVLLISGAESRELVYEQTRVVVNAMHSSPVSSASNSTVKLFQISKTSHRRRRPEDAKKELSNGDITGGNPGGGVAGMAISVMVHSD